MFSSRRNRFADLFLQRSCLERDSLTVSRTHLLHPQQTQVQQGGKVVELKGCSDDLRWKWTTIAAVRVDAVELGDRWSPVGKPAVHLKFVAVDFCMVYDY